MIGISPAGQRQVDRLADQVLVARIFGVDGDGRVAEHRLGAGGGDVEDLAGGRVGDGVLDRPEMCPGRLRSRSRRRPRRSGGGCPS